jgi:ATP/maltotriose-dependent transcriptional regulator MalT
MNGDTSVIPKISRPSVASSYHRADLHNLLDELSPRPLVIVSGPLGMGKSTLVATYIASRNLPNIWYQVDKGDNDLATFFHSFGIAAREAIPHNKPAMAHLPPDFSQGIAEFAKRFFQELFRHLEVPFLIVLDNYHEIEQDAALHEAILVACAKLPQRGRIVIITSKNVPPPLARLRAGNMVAIIEQDDL